MKKIFLILSIASLISCGQRAVKETKNEPARKERSSSETKIKADSSITPNKGKEKKVSLTENESDFLITAADGRMMGILEGKAAVEKGTTKEIKDYGQLMIKDQKAMLAGLKNIAQQLSVTLPDSISGEKQDGLEDLMEKESKKFDKKFVKMMKIDHRRDVRLFTRAREYDNPKIKTFASQYLPMVESHLAKVKELRKNKDQKTSSKQ
jgi:putative membrane protein